MILDGLILNCTQKMILAMSPLERWQAVRTWDPGLLTNHWFILGCVIVMVALAVLLFWVSLRRVSQEKRPDDRAFMHLAEEKAMTDHECQRLKMIAKMSGMPRPEAVFSNRGAFERGAVQMMEASPSGQGSQEKQQLITEVSRLREKIGFDEKQAVLGGNQTRLQSSRQIPVSKQVTLLRSPVGETKGSEATVCSNKNHEFCVRLDETIKVILGGLWTVRYAYGASVWEFDTSVLSYDGSVLALTHSDRVRFVNRRRFLRVPVTRRALVARFPFEQAFEWADRPVKGKNSKKKTVPVHPIETCGSPEFVPATVTELAGPGLRIETSLQISQGERVLVVFDLEAEPVVSDESVDVDRKSHLIEDIGEVRHVKHTKKGVSMAVELYGLKDADVDELIRAANVASIKGHEQRTAINKKRSQVKKQEVAV